MRNETECSNKENKKQWKREREKEEQRGKQNSQKTMNKMAVVSPYPTVSKHK